MNETTWGIAGANGKDSTGSEDQESSEWHDYPTDGERPVVGTLMVSPPLYGPAEGVTRRLLVHLPPSYSGTQKRLLYMHDGQNLFDEATSYSGEWQVDETAEALRSERIEAIVVGVENAGNWRAWDYSPHMHSLYGGGGGDAYVDLLVHSIKPLVDRTFRTMPDRDYAGLMGSSMGGSISLYGMLRRPGVFGFAA